VPHVVTAAGSKKKTRHFETKGKPPDRQNLEGKTWKVESRKKLQKSRERPGAPPVRKNSNCVDRKWRGGQG